MSFNFQDNDPSLESQWRALILFGKNSATYKFAFAKTLLELTSKETNSLSLKDLAPIYVDSILKHIKTSDKQGNSASSTFLNACRNYNDNKISYDQLLHITEKYGFEVVVDAFQNINGGTIQKPFYHKDYTKGSKRIIITDELLQLKDNYQFHNLNDEVEAR